MKSTASQVSQRGVQFIEAALGLPVLILAIFAIIEFGRFLYLRSMVAGAAEQAASLASTQPGLEEEDITIGGKNVFRDAQAAVEAAATRWLLERGIPNSSVAGTFVKSVQLTVPSGDALRGVTRRRVLESQPIAVSVRFQFSSLFPAAFGTREVEVRAASYRELSRKVTTPVAIDCWGQPALLLSEVRPECPCGGKGDDPRWVANPRDPAHCMCTTNIPHINFAYKAYGGGPQNMNGEGRIGMTAGPDGECLCGSPYGGRYEYNPVSQQCECAYPTREDLRTKFTGCYAADGTRIGWFHPKECQCKSCGPNTVAAEDPNQYLSATCVCSPDFTCPPGTQIVANFWGQGCYCAPPGGSCGSPLISNGQGGCKCGNSCGPQLYQDPVSCRCYCNTSSGDVTALVPTNDPSVCSQNGNCSWSSATNTWECHYGDG